MNKNDLEWVRKFLKEVPFFFINNLFILLIFLSYGILFPIQILNWIKSKTPWGETQPYLFLYYLLIWCEAAQKSAIPPYSEWKGSRRKKE